MSTFQLALLEEPSTRNDILVSWSHLPHNGINCIDLDYILYDNAVRQTLQNSLDYWPCNVPILSIKIELKAKGIGEPIYVPTHTYRYWMDILNIIPRLAVF